MDGAADFFVTADDGVEFAGGGRLGEIARIALQGIVALLGRRGVGRAALADFVDRSVEPLRRDAGIRQDLRRVGALLEGQCQQQPLGRHVLVASLLGYLFGGIEDAGELGGHVKLAGAAARYLGSLGECRLAGRERRLGVAARLANKARGEPLVVVEQHLQQMIGRELLMALAKRKALRRLNEAACAVRKLFKIHGSLLGVPIRPNGTVPAPSTSG